MPWMVPPDRVYMIPPVVDGLTLGMVFSECLG